MRDVVIVDSVRTGLAKSFRGSFNLTRPDDQVAHCIDALLERNGEVDPTEIEDVIVGAASQIGEQGGNLARLAVILSSLPTSTAGTTISRACSSGLNSIAMAATQIAKWFLRNHDCWRGRIYFCGAATNTREVKFSSIYIREISRYIYGNGKHCGSSGKKI